MSESEGNGFAGPACAYLREAIAARSGEDVHVVVTFNRRAGDVVVEPPPGARLDRVAAACARVPGVDAVRQAGPRLYVSFDPYALADLVADAVLGADRYGALPASGRRSAVVFSDPNLNKPLHLGHLRNNALGCALVHLFANRGDSAQGHISHADWGPHMCQALLAYERWGAGRTPADAGLKSDHFVGRHYILFHEAETEQRERLGVPKGARSPLQDEVYDLLRRLDAGDPAVCAAYDRLVRWADEGIRRTYARIGTHADLWLSDRDCLPAARHAIDEAVRSGVCVRRADGSVHLAGTEMTLLRRDGTTTVYAQWLGCDVWRAATGPYDEVVQVAGSEWALGEETYARLRAGCGLEAGARWTVLTYGMVRLSGRKMKSRTGDAVSIDGILDRAATELAAREPIFASDAEAAAAGAIKLFLLRAPLHRDVDWDEHVFFGRAVPAYRALATAGSAGPSRAAHVRDVALAIEAFPSVAVAAASRLDVARLASAAELLGRAAAAGALPARLADATRRVAHRALDLLGCPVSADLPSAVSAGVLS